VKHRQLSKSYFEHFIHQVHVRGHQGIHGNEEADRLANEGALSRKGWN